MRCPSCEDTYRAGVTRCVDCGRSLVDGENTNLPADDAGDSPSQPSGRSSAATSSLGWFDPAVVDAVVGLAARRGTHTEVISHGGAVEVLTSPADRNPLCVELVSCWDGLLAELDPAVRANLDADAQLPGWHDPPEGLWVDRAGQLRVAARSGEHAGPDQRVVGPALTTVAGLLLVYAWYAGVGLTRLVAGVAGLALLLVGAFLPR